MTYINTRLNWEEVFFQEALELEEKMISLDLQSLTKSKLRLSLEKNILGWKKYEGWMTQTANVKSLRDELSADHLAKITEQAQDTLTEYHHHTFWNEDLIPYAVWDGHLVVLGLAYNENLAAIGNFIFILADPKTLTFICQKLFPEASQSPELTADDDSLEIPEPEENSLLSGIDLKQEKTEINFKAGNLFNPGAKPDLDLSKPADSGSESLWDYLSERHDEYCFEAKKKFDAYVVLKIVDSKTSIYKMDSEIQKNISNSKVFEQSVIEDNPFSKVFKTGLSESFNMNQLGQTLLDYNYICITALKRGPTVIGFLVGLKSKRLGAEDEILLQDLAKESA